MADPGPKSERGVIRQGARIGGISCMSCLTFTVLAIVAVVILVALIGGSASHT